MVIWFEIRFWSWAAWFVFTRLLAAVSLATGTACVIRLLLDRIRHGAWWDGSETMHPATGVALVAVMMSAAVTGAIVIKRNPEAPKPAADEP